MKWDKWTKRSIQIQNTNELNARKIHPPGDSGKTNVTVTRNGATLVSMDKPVPPLPTPTSKRT